MEIITVLVLRLLDAYNLIKNAMITDKKGIL